MAEAAALQEAGVGKRGGDGLRSMHEEGLALLACAAHNERRHGD